MIVFIVIGTACVTSVSLFLWVFYPVGVQIGDGYKEVRDS